MFVESQSWDGRVIIILWLRPGIELISMCAYSYCGAQTQRKRMSTEHTVVVSSMACILARFASLRPLAPSLLSVPSPSALPTCPVTLWRQSRRVCVGEWVGDERMHIQAVCVGLPAAHCSSLLSPPSELSPPHEHCTAVIPLGHSCEGRRVCV